MPLSSTDQIRSLYDTSADWYESIMEKEIDLPIYAEILGGLAERLEGREGSLLDTSCGSGHMMLKYRTDHDATRPLRAIDLSPKMVEITRRRLGEDVIVEVGDMRSLETIPDNSQAGIISFFALHHLRPEEIPPTLREWHRVLQPDGALVLGTWEGNGLIDYGEESDLEAFRYSQQEIDTWIKQAGFLIDRSRVEPVEGMGMDAVYVEGRDSDSA